MTTGGNYFELFGLPQGHAIDLAELDAAYERLSLETHPDFFTTAGKDEQARSQRLSAEVNEGYRVLRSDAERSAYLLGLLAADGELDTNRLPSGFLGDMFALQEEVDVLKEQEDEAALAALRAQVEGRLAKVRGEREGLFAHAQNGAAGEALQDIQTNLNCEKYLSRLLDRLV